MATTTPDALVTPDAGSNYALTQDLAYLADRVQIMGNKIRSEMPVPKVTNAADRDAKFPTPAQGDRVWRMDLNAMEVYYSLYNATTNPGGSTTAGWYQPNSSVARSRNAAYTIPAAGATIDYNVSDGDIGGLFSYSSGVLTCRVSGNVKINASVTASTGTTFFTIRLHKNGAAFRAAGMGLSSSSNSTNTISTIVPVVAGDTIDIRISAGVNVGGVVTDGGPATYFSASY